MTWDLQIVVKSEVARGRGRVPGRGRRGGEGGEPKASSRWKSGRRGESPETGEEEGYGSSPGSRVRTEKIGKSKGTCQVRQSTEISGKLW